ncbi:MAG: hypothetical protein ABR541_05025 [Candidatus Dormibacteria bacterium]
MPCALEALVAAPAVLRQLVARAPSAQVVRLDPSLSLVPLTDELFDELASATGQTHDDAFAKFPPGLDPVLAELSRTAPIAYVEANYFGGMGSQAAALWQGGDLRYGPERIDDDVVDPRPISERPVNRALRRLGVRVDPDALDEWDTVRLSRHADSEDWLNEPGEGISATG